MKRLFMMCGLPFAGKTTLGRRLVAHLDAAWVSLDEINEERGLANGGTGLPAEEWERTRHVALGRLDGLMRSGRDVVVDDTCCIRWLREGYREIASRHGYESFVVFMDIPRDELQRRREDNDLHGRREPMKDEVFDSVARTFEYPADDEATMIFRFPDQIDAWLRTHLYQATPQLP